MQHMPQWTKQHYMSPLDVLRSSGLTRQQEVTKMFTGGLQRVARLTVDEYESQRKKNEERQAIRDQKKVRHPSYKRTMIMQIVITADNQQAQELKWHSEFMIAI